MNYNYLISFPEITVSLSMGSNLTEGTMETIDVILSDVPSGGTEVAIVVVLEEIFGTAGGDVIIIECCIHTHNHNNSTLLLITCMYLFVTNPVV